VRVPPQLVLLYGPPGSGKSTLAAAEWAPDDVLSIDRIVVLATGRPPAYAEPETTAFAWADLLRLAAHRLTRGAPFAVDATVLVPGSRRDLVRLTRGWARTRVDRMAASLEECLRRNAARPDGYRVSDRRVVGAYEAMAAVSDVELLREGWDEVRWCG
jgi:predicted kinase